MPAAGESQNGSCARSPEQPPRRRAQTRPPATLTAITAVSRADLLRCSALASRRFGGDGGLGYCAGGAVMIPVLRLGMVAGSQASRLHAVRAKQARPRVCAWVCAWVGFKRHEQHEQDWGASVGVTRRATRPPS